MKNLIIFVLTLVAISSVFSMKLNKVLKEEKILTVSKVNNDEQLDKNFKIQRRDRDDDDNDRPKKGRKNEITNENYSLQDICKQTEEGFVGKKSELDVILSALNCFASVSKIESSSEKMLKGVEEDCNITRNSGSDAMLIEAILSALGCS